MQITSWPANATQNHTRLITLRTPTDRSGNTLPGPVKTYVSTIRQSREGNHTSCVRCGRSSYDGYDRSKNLCRNKSECNMDPGKSLKQYHAKSNSLNGVQQPEPEPQRAANKCRCDGTADPRQIQSDRRCAPKYLTPTWCSEANGENG